MIRIGIKNNASVGVTIHSARRVGCIGFPFATIEALPLSCFKKFLLIFCLQEWLKIVAAKIEFF
jgi:hypothetical protein